LALVARTAPAVRIEPVEAIEACNYPSKDEINR